MEENALSDAESGDANDEPTETDIMAAANKIVKEHIKLLHEYNELKDVGQGLMGLIADQRGVRIVEVQEEFGIDAQD
ncbi:DNA repair protein [Alternaria rosae]|nr:DNA repair protein [Alternaria rosae]KAH6844478.1 DNA repair protein [Alternaria rosae]